MLEKNKKLSSLVRLLASLCLIGGLTAATGCVGGGGGGGNNGEDCASGEVFVDQLGECKTECQSAPDCNSNENCQAVATQNTSVCIEVSSGDTGMDTNNDTGTDTGGDTGSACESGEIEVAETCLTECSGQGDCDGNYECQQVTQGGDMACVYVNGTLGQACETAADCNGPNPDTIPNGQAACIDEDQDGNVIAPGGLCVAAPCDPRAPLVSSGCGVDGICLPSGQQALCFKFCQGNSDCPRGDTEDYSCNILAVQQGQKIGYCFTGCSDNTDCELEGDNGPIQGRCNSQNYCETPCDPANQDGQQSCEAAGGTCEQDSNSPDGGYCVFD